VKALLLLVMAGLFWPVAGFAIPMPDCAGDLIAANTHVVRVENNGTLVLDKGQRVLLESLRLPGEDQPGAPVAGEALAALRAMTAKQPLTLTSTSPRNDRYGRIRVQAFGTAWLQVELLKLGLARVSVMPDRQECSPDFYEAEIAARQARRGLWALPEFAVRNAGAFTAPAGSFQIVQGRIVNVASHDGRTFLDFNEDYRKGFSAIIAPEDRKAFRDSDPALEELVGREIRVRGIVEDFNGRREMALSNPRQIELVE
jgi:endonuclease YncB( thermonuclease family)